MLKIILNFEQRNQIAIAVEKLFMFQGKKADKIEIAEWVEEIAGWSFPVDVLVKAIKSLNACEPRMFKLGTIQNACREMFANVNDSGQFKGDLVTEEERKVNAARIAILKKKYGSVWFMHFNDTYILKEEIKPDPVVGVNDSIEPD